MSRRWAFEAGVVLGQDGEPIHWHVPPDRTGGSLPDSRQLWEVLWDRRHEVRAFAHTHPGVGRPCPSLEDVTTFAAVEAALGQRLDWYILSADSIVIVRWQGPARYRYHIHYDVRGTPPAWADELRRRSTEEETP